jgi:hypothetical protein
MRHLILGTIAAASFAALSLAVTLPAHAQVAVGISVNFAPPVLPVYEQPAMPAPGYIWVPGYWAWDDEYADYYWVPGTWEQPPSVGLLWTPGYWGFTNGLYVWNGGYWGPQVGFYGGIDYGYGYRGSGYEGGYWRGERFYYNRAVNNFGGVHVTNVYNQTVVNNINVTRVSYNGGQGGTSVRPTAQQYAIAHQHHVAPTSVQQQHQTLARNDQNLRAKVNGGHPAIAATAKPTSFHGPGVVAARDAHPGNATAGRNEQPQRAEQQRTEQQRNQHIAQAQPARPEPRNEAAPPRPQAQPPKPESRGGTPETQREATSPRSTATTRGQQESRPGSAEPQHAPSPRPQATPRTVPENRGGTSEPQRPPASAPPPNRPPEARSAPSPRPQQPPHATPAPAAPHAQPQQPPHQAPQHEPQGRPQGHPEQHPQQPQQRDRDQQGH